MGFMSIYFRLLETMMRHNVKLTSQDLGLLLKFLIFETTKRALAISFVQRLRLEGRIPDLKV